MENYEQIKIQNEWLKKILAVILSVAIVSLVFNFRGYIFPNLALLKGLQGNQKALTLGERVLPSGGVELPIVWGDLGKRMIQSGVIDAEKLEQVYASRGGLTEDEKKLLYGADNGKLVIYKQNAPFILNLLWAFGLGNKSDVLSRGPIAIPKFGDPSRLASTAGWTLATGEAMGHLNMHDFVSLDETMQNKVGIIASSIYRPCCDNPTVFPDCNHGMAMLGLLELLAASGVSEEEIFRIALQVNSYWFPENYVTIARFFEKQGVAWEDVIPKEVLSYTYSSNSGYKDILSKGEEIVPQEGGSSCST
jgi:hypothetical protein